jgi:hypothetical protein
MSEYDLIHPSKGVVPYDRFNALVNRTLDQIQETTGSLPESSASLRFDLSGMSVRHKQTGELIPLSEVVAIVSYEISTGTTPLRAYSYEDKALNHEAAIANLNWGPLHGKLVIAKEFGKDGNIVYIPDNRSRQA